MVRRTLAVFSFAILVAVAWLAASTLIPVRPPAETILEITPGMSSKQIAKMLSSHGVIRNPYAFDAWRLVYGGKLQAGEYRFADPASLRQVYDRIRRGDVYLHAVTIPEGFNLFEVAATIEDAHLASKQDFLAAARKDVDLVANLDPHANDLEGYLFPDTYRFPKHATPRQMLAAMVKRFQGAAASIGITSDYHQIVTLASLVEKETPVAADRPMVASVFVNRLAKGMPLMTDPTVIYAAELEGRYRGTIYQSDLHSESAYNTYRHPGLPPGPICNPGIAALQAAENPAKTDYLYFVADPADPGHSRFASTLAGHQQNVQAYRNSLKAAQR